MKFNKLFALASLFVAGNALAATFSETSYIDDAKNCKTKATAYADTHVGFSFMNKSARPVKISVWGGDISPVGSKAYYGDNPLASTETQAWKSKKTDNLVYNLEISKENLSKPIVLRIQDGDKSVFYTFATSKPVYLTWDPSEDKQNKWYSIENLKSLYKGKRNDLRAQTGLSTGGFFSSERALTSACLDKTNAIADIDIKPITLSQLIASKDTKSDDWTYNNKKGYGYKLQEGGKTLKA